MTRYSISAVVLAEQPFRLPGFSMKMGGMRFDVVEKGVNWCNAKIKKDHPNFNFRYVPLNNDLYNPSSLAKASEFHFPYADEQFDLAFLFSIFTHMQTEEIDHYLTEIYRVLKPGGKCLATFFLYKEEK